MSSSFDRIKTLIEILEGTINPLDRLSPLLTVYHKCVLALQRMCSSTSNCTILPVNIPTVVTMSVLPGRPKVHINIELYELLRDAGYTLDETALVLGTSRTTLWRQLKECNLCVYIFIYYIYI